MEKRKQELRQALRNLRGNRTFRQYAEDCGVSYTTLNQIETGVTFPSRKTIEKITSSSANPQNGISYEYLMELAGYSGNTLFMEDDFGNESEELDEENKLNSLDDCYMNRIAKVLEEDFIQQKIAFTKTNKFWRQEFAIAGMKNVSNRHSSTGIIDKTYYDIWNNKKFKKIIVDWFLCRPHCFKLKDYVYIFKTILWRLSREDINPSTIYTVVVDDFDGFQKMVHHLTTHVIRCNVSLLFVDMEKQQIISEAILARYYEEDSGRGDSYKGWTTLNK